MWRKFVKLGFLMLAVIVTGCSFRTVKESSESQTSMESDLKEDTIQVEESTPPPELNKEEIAKNQRWPYNNYDQREWLPNGEYYACFFNNGLDLYNTNNEHERHVELREDISVKDYYVLACNSYFFLYPDKDYEDETGHNIIWKDREGNYLLSDTLQIDWYGNIIREQPKVQEKKDDQGNTVYYLEEKEVTPIVGTLQYQGSVEWLDDDWILFVLSRDYFVNDFYYYIPSEDRLVSLGEHDSNHWSVMTPLGMVWKENPYLYLTTKEGTTTMFGGQKIQYFDTTDQILLVALEEEWDAKMGYATAPIYYASYDDLELHKIDNIGVYLAPTEIGAFEHYVIYRDYVEGQGAGFRVYDTNTGDSWFTYVENDNGWSSRLEGFRLTEGELEIIIFMNNRDSDEKQTGYYVMTKDQLVHCPNQSTEPYGYSPHLNKQKTYYIHASADYSLFSIKPFCRD